MTKLSDIFKARQGALQAQTTKPAEATKVLIDGLRFALDAERLTATVLGCDDGREGEVKIPESVVCGPQTFTVVSIAAGAFGHCKGLTSTSIPSTVTTIGKDAFRQCKELESVTCLSTAPPACGPGVMAYVSGTDCTLMVPAKSLSRYQQTEPWSHFMTIIGLQYSAGRK